jgi:hypothetical protein
MPNKKRLLVVIPAILIFTLVILAVGAFFAIEYHATTTLKEQIDQNIKELSQYIRVEYDSLGVDWLSYSVIMKKVRLSKPPLPGSITIDRVSVRDLTSIGIKWIPTVVVLDNVAGSVMDASVGVQRLAATFSLNKIPSQEELANDWTVFLKNLRDGRLEMENLAFSDKESQFQVAAFKSQYANSDGKYRNLDLKLNNIKLQTGAMQITSDSFGFAASLDQHDVLNRISKNVENLFFQIPPALAKKSPFLEKLTDLGYDRLSLGGGFTYVYQPDTNNLSLTWDASGADMGRLQVDLRLTDFDSPPVPLDGSLARLVHFLEQLLHPAQKASFQGLRAAYQDFGLAPRIIKAEAQSRGQSPEAFTRTLVGGISASLLFLPLPASIKEQVAAVNTFLLNPKEIQVDITSKKPVRLKDLEGSSLNGLLELFGNTEVKITAK